ncbi:MAG: hypothetical protein R2940_08180 [Syntrophotaleaceae bacterium]
MKGKQLFFFLSVLLLFVVQHRAFAGDGRSVGLFGGRACYDTLRETLSPSEYADSYVSALIVNKEIKDIGRHLRLEGEGQVVKHWGLQDHFEFNALIGLRWLTFPWDRYLDTSFAIGEGLSYATDDPEIEVEKHDRTSRLLNYLMFELALQVPQQTEWTLFARIHHRSGVFGLFDGMSGGSNVVGAGVRYTF